MAQMTAVQVSRPGAAFEVITKALPEPGPDQVRLKVQACGICHGDVFLKEGHWPSLQYPRVTGHEVAGVIDAVGPDVTRWKNASGSAWAGMAAIAVTVSPAAAAISSAATISRSRDSISMAAMPNT